MLSTALIVFREVLEAALVVSIVMAATKGVPRRGWWVGGGLAGGVIGAGLIAAFADGISQWASGMGQEVFNAGVMFVATLMLAWHSIWMSRHGREMAMQMTAVGRAVADGSKPLTGWRSWSASRYCAKAPRPCCSCTASRRAIQGRRRR